MGLFPSAPGFSPRLVITNGMVVPNYSSRQDYDKYFGLGVSMYGQMTAGSYCYIGPQGIVHGTVVRDDICWNEYRSPRGGEVEGGGAHQSRSPTITTL